MGHSLAFDEVASEDGETVALRELNDFLEKPKSSGLDNVKEVLRNSVQLMMELKGYVTGYAIQHLMLGEHSSLAMNGVLRDDDEKKRRIEDFWREFLKLERLMIIDFQLFLHVGNQVNLFHRLLICFGMLYSIVKRILLSWQTKVQLLERCYLALR